jgi:uncharacterized membrane protein
MAEDELPIPSPENKSDLNKADAVDFLEVLTKQNPQIFNGLDKKKRDQIVQAITVSFMQVQKSHSGPLPDAETLEHYARIIPNGAERVMVMAEKEQEFRHIYSDKVSYRQLNQISRGQIFGFSIAILGIGGGIFLSYEGKETTGLTTIISSMVLLAGAFITGKVQDKKH